MVIEIATMTRATGNALFLWCLFVCMINRHDCLSDTTVDDLDLLNSELQDVGIELHSLEQNDFLSYHRLREVKLTMAELEGVVCPRPRLDFLCTAPGLPYNRRCLPNHQVCDGHSDCPDGEDEVDCDITKYFQLGDVRDFKLLYSTCMSFVAELGNHTYQAMKMHPQLPNVPQVTIHSQYDVVNPDGSVTHIDTHFDSDWIFSSTALYVQSKGSFYDGIDYYQSLDPLTGGNTGVKYVVRQSTGEECGRYSLAKVG